MTIQPEGENVRKAVRWISAERQERPATAITELIDRACLAFNLSPIEADALVRLMRSNQRAAD